MDDSAHLELVLLRLELAGEPRSAVTVRRRCQVGGGFTPSDRELADTWRRVREVVDGYRRRAVGDGEASRQPGP